MKNRPLKQICKLVGIRGAIALTRGYGGRTLTVPMKTNLRDLHPIVVLLGWEAARTLCDKLGGTHLELPSEVNALLELRNHDITQRFIAGSSIRRLSVEFGLDRKAIQKIIDHAGYEELRMSRSVTTP